MLPLLTNIKRCNVSGLGPRQGDRPPKGQVCAGFKRIAEQAWQTAIKVINNHRARIHESVLQIFDASRKITYAVANTVIETREVFSTTSLDGILDLRSYRVNFRPQAACGRNVQLQVACIWATDSSQKHGFRPIMIFQSRPGLEAAGVKELLCHLGECLFFTCPCLLDDAIFVLQKQCQGYIRMARS